MNAIEEYIKKTQFKVDLATHIKNQTLISKTDEVKRLLDEVKQGITEEEQIIIKNHD